MEKFVPPFEELNGGRFSGGILLFCQLDLWTSTLNLKICDQGEQSLDLYAHWIEFQEWLIAVRVVFSENWGIYVQVLVMHAS